MQHLKALLRLAFFTFIGYNIPLQGQPTALPHSIINTLCADSMYGRGYVNGGDKTAAMFIKNELEQSGVRAYDGEYFQPFTFPMNSFGGRMEIKLNDRTLKPVYDYVVAPESKTTRGTYPLIYLPMAADTVDAIWDSIIDVDYTNAFVVADFPKRNMQHTNPFRAAGVVVASKKLFWWASTGQYEARVPMVYIYDSLLNLHPKSIAVDFENYFFDAYPTQNIAGYVSGSQQPDSLIVFTAHYDHLGCMGRTNVFKGAHDNASGTAMVLTLANYFAKRENKPKTSIAFVFFAAEEVGLLGSGYFVEHPIFPLSKIKALINLDMVGSGSEGITVVDGKTQVKIVNVLKEINTKYSYFSDIQLRDDACNSDHCSFKKAKVPAVFIYTRGSECKAYHNLDDTPDNLPLTKFNELQELLIKFTEQY